MNRTVSVADLGGRRFLDLHESTRTPPPQGPPSEGSTPGATKPWASPVLWTVLAFAGVALAWIYAVHRIQDPGFNRSAAAPSPLEGLTIFAVFFVAAAGIERLLEPLASLVSADTKAEYEQAMNAAADKWDAYAEAVKAHKEAADDKKVALQGTADEAFEGLKEAMGAAAAKKSAVSSLTRVVKVVFWAVASIIGILVAASFKLYLLRRVGIASPPRALEILATGLIIGAGTKPLHDLVILIEKKKEQAQSPATT